MFEAGWKTLKTCKGKNVAWNIIWNLLLWRRSQLHIFTSCNSHLTFLTLVGGGGAIIILSKVLNSFNDIFRWETSTSVQRKSQKGNLRQILFLFTFYQWKYFSGLWEMTTFSIFISKMQNDRAGNFVVYSPEVSLKIRSFRHPFRLPVWDFGRPRVHCRCLWRPGAHLAAVLSHSLSMSVSQIYLESVSQSASS